MYPLIRIIQWREHGDDDDTITKRVVLSAEAEEETNDHEFICAAYNLDPALDFDEGGITIIDTIDISAGRVEAGSAVVVTITPEEQ